MEEKIASSTVILADFADKCPNLELVMFFGHMLTEVEKLNNALKDVKLDLVVDLKVL